MKPILFNTEMVKAILDGRKTQTRRVIPLKNNDLIFTGFVVSSTAKNREGYCAFGKNKEQDLEFIKPKYKVGDILYVREPCKIMTLKGCHTDKSLILVYKYRNDITNIEYKIKLPDRFYKKDNVVPDWVSWFGKTIIPSGSIKEMARIFLRVTNIRVERLQDISVRDIEKETGWRREIYSYSNKNKAFFKDFRDFWNSTAKDGYKWEDNPCVFVDDIERIHDV